MELGYHTHRDQESKQRKKRWGGVKMMQSENTQTIAPWLRSHYAFGGHTSMSLIFKKLLPNWKARFMQWDNKIIPKSSMWLNVKTKPHATEERALSCVIKSGDVNSNHGSAGVSWHWQAHLNSSDLSKKLNYMIS